MKKIYKIKVNGKAFEVELEGVSSSEGKVEVAAPATPVPVQNTSGANEDIVAPMPGAIVDIRVNNGESVEKGQIVAVLEAMKMETEILAPNAGQVSAIHVAKGAQVNLGDTIVSLG